MIIISLSIGLFGPWQSHTWRAAAQRRHSSSWSLSPALAISPGAIIAMETGDIHRFADAKHYVFPRQKQWNDHYNPFQQSERRCLPCHVKLVYVDIV